MSRAARAVPEVLAAVDLGSNSFHLVVARYSHGQLVVIDRLREMVRLGAGVGEDGRIDKEVAARALACLQRFGQRLRDMHARSVRVVGTNALRVARRKQAFLERAREALGHPIEIVSGMEEARLIYSGVAHTLPAEPGRRLVVDIGGGSTEMIVGEGHEPLLLESLQIGCVSLSRRFFGDGKLSPKRIARARLAARLELEPVQAAFLRRGWDRAVGSSGTVHAIAEGVRELDPTSTAITPKGLGALLEALEHAGHVRALELGAVTEERRAVFPGGVVIMAEIFDALNLQQMRFAEGALRDGLLHDMIGRYGAEDAARAHRVVDAAALPRRRRARPVASRPRCSASSRRCASPGSSPSRWRSRRWSGRRGCTRSASTSRTAAITGTAPTCSRTRTCPVSRARSSCCSRAWSVRTGASSRSKASRT